MLKDKISLLLNTYPRSIDLSLVRIKDVLHELGNPHLKLPSIVHIGGTNGKGSVAAMLFSIQRAAGKKVHLYTSPHLIRVNERIKLAGTEVDDESLYYALREIHKYNKNNNLTRFELLTSAAFLLFSQIKADISIIEVGLGGRLDATNIINKPCISALTPISHDHIEYLGNNLEKITIEKAGILKSGVTSVVSRQPEKVMKVLEKFSTKIGSNLVRYEKDWCRKKDILHYKDRRIKLTPRMLQGDHQADNAALAAMISMCHKNFLVNQNHISIGLSQVCWPGRLQRLNGKLSKILEESELWADGAHNVGGIKVLLEWINKYNRKVIFIIALGKKKSAKYFINALVEANPKLVITLPLPGCNGIEAATLSDILNSKGIAAMVSNDLVNALKICNALEQKFTIIVTGSLYLVGKALNLDNA